MGRVSILILLAAQCLPGATAARELASQIRAAALDPQECYLVRDLHFVREDLRFYFTQGALIFGKPVGGRTIAAVFSAEMEGGDAEIVVLPPTRSERLSLATYTGAPNLSEHFQQALMLFTDDSAEALRTAIRERGETRRSPERGLLLASRFDSVLGNLSASFIARLVGHLLGPEPGQGLFYAALTSAKLGNFDVAYDPEWHEQIYLGQLRNREGRAFYDTWTHFQARSFRDGRREPPEGAFRLQDYRIQAVLNPDLGMEATTQATLIAHRDGLRVLQVEIAAGMSVGAVRINGEPAEVFMAESMRSNLMRRAESVLFLVLPAQPLERGRAYTIEFEHAGRVVRRAEGGVYFVGSRNTWYPQASRGLSRYDITFTYPADLQIVFPGELKEQSEGNGVRTTRRVTGEPILMAGFNLGHFEQSTATRGGLTVEVYANRSIERELQPPPKLVLTPGTLGSPGRGRAMPEVRVETPQAPDPTARLSRLAVEVASAYGFFSERFGPPSLPRLMVSPIPGTFGQGFPGLVYMSTISYLNEQERPAAARAPEMRTFFSELLYAHETAHQWWGTAVIAESPEDAWLMEALADYCALLLIEHNQGSAAMMGVLEAYRNRLLARDDRGRPVESAGPIRLGVRLQDSLPAEEWSTIIYGKGSWIMHMLRRRIGDANFMKLLAGIAADHRHKTLNTAEFRNKAAAYLPADAPDSSLDGFFEHWVEGIGIPSLSLRTSTSGRAPNMALTMTLIQSGVDDRASFAVPVEVQLGRGRTETYWMSTGPGPTVLTVPVEARPLRVALDPNGSVLRN